MKNKITKLPTYPEFKPVSIEDKDIIDRFNHKDEVVDDFLFSTLLIWSRLRSKNSYSILNDNLVVKSLIDINSDSLALSLQGVNKIEETVDILLKDWSNLYLVPEKVINALPKGKYVIKPVENYYDYVFDTNLIAKLSGSDFYRRRRDLTKVFNGGDHVKVKQIDLSNPNTQKELFDLYNRWALIKDVTSTDLTHEKEAFERFLEYQKYIDKIALGCYSGGQIVGFQINELVSGSKVAYAHFNKSDLSLRGVSTLLMHDSGQILKEKGYTHLNHGCDLGNLGLREYKTSLRPSFKIKKYNISFKESS